MNVSPIDLQKALRGMDYPASKQDLISCAQGNDAGGDVVDALQAVPEQEYDGPNKVSAAVADAT